MKDLMCGLVPNHDPNTKDRIVGEISGGTFGDGHLFIGKQWVSCRLSKYSS